MSEKLKYAEWFIQHGYAIFPIDPQSKKPAIAEWQKYSSTPLTEEEKQKFSKMVEEKYNYAIPGGQNNLVILDVEDKELLEKWISKKALDELCRKTLCVNTVHGGVHIYVISDEIPEHKFNPAFVLNGKTVMDIQSFNSYVVGVGSCINHKFCDSSKCKWKGQEYTSCYSLYNNELVQIGKLDLRGFLKFLAEKGKDLGIELTSNARAWVYGGNGKEELDEVKEFEELKKELAKYDNGKSIDRIKQEICSKKKIPQKVKAVICEGKTYSQIEVKDRSTTDFHIITYLMENGVTDPDKILQLLPHDSKMHNDEKWDVKKYQAITFTNAWERVKPFIQFSKETIGKNEKEKKKIVRKIITEAILERYKVRTFYQTTGHNQAIVGIFVWNKKKGIYTPFEKVLRKTIRKLAVSLQIYSRDKTLARLSKRDVDDIVDEIKDLTLTPLPVEPLRIAFRNGTIEWGDKVEFYMERTQKQFSFYYLPWTVNYEEIKKMKGLSTQDIEDLARRVCPKSLETFKAWVGDKWILLYEIIGYTFYPGIKFRKAFMLVGEGKNGKSSFINLVKKILGDYAVSFSPRELFDPQQRFVVGQLYHKLANAVAESKDYSIDDMDRVKRLTGDDWITADVKFKDPITFKNVAKLIIASNNMPHVRDTNDKAFWHRWVIIEFPHQFADNDMWFDKTFTEEEINGIITTALASIERAFEQGHFDFEQSEEEVMDIWLSHTDSVYSFIKEYTEKGILQLVPRNGDLYIPKYKLHKLYYGYCSDNGYRGVDERKIPKLLRQYFNITVSRKTIEVKDKETGEYKPMRVKCYVGIGLNEAVKKSTDDYDMIAVSIDEFNEFIAYVRDNNGAEKTFEELVHDFGDKKKATNFVKFCKKKNMCYEIGLYKYRIVS